MTIGTACYIHEVLKKEVEINEKHLEFVQDNGLSGYAEELAIEGLETAKFVLDEYENMEINLLCGGRTEREMDKAREALWESEQMMECKPKRKPFWRR